MYLKNYYIYYSIYNKMVININNRKKQVDKIRGEYG